MQVSADCHDCLGCADIWPASCVIKRRTVLVIHYRNPSGLVYSRRPECFECLSLSQIETVIRASKQLEQLLAQHYGATGRGLHEKTSSVEDQIDSDTVRRLRKIATLRNKVVHEDFEIDDLIDFQCDAQSLAQQLAPQPQPKTTGQPRPRTKSTVKSNTSESDTSQPKSNLRTPTKANASPNKTLTPQPRVQPRVQLPTQHKPQSTKKTQPTPQPSAAKPTTQAIFPAISGLLIFLAIIWILAH